MAFDHADYSRKKAAQKKEIGEIPPIADVERRRRCMGSLRLFCDTYNPASFCLPWSESQLRGAARIEECVRGHALYAMAEPRGDGKSTRCRMAALWSVSYGFKRYAFLLNANKDKGKEAIGFISTWIRFLPDYVADFPEIAWPAIAIGGIANRADGQTCGGASTMIQWGKEKLILATVPPPPNWPKDWPLREDGMAPTSGSAIGASGLSGEGIRGSAIPLTSGETLRPDLVLLDDPQTDTSARSKRQNSVRLRLVNGAVLGMAGPGKGISALAAMTVIEPGDLADTLLDRDKNPLWRGTRGKLMESMPADMEAWEGYFEVYRDCAAYEPPGLVPGSPEYIAKQFSKANEYYLEHRETLDRGAVASWPARKYDHEISAVQHALGLYCREPGSFFAEMMNDPKGQIAAAGLKELSAGKILDRLNRVPRGQVPRECRRLTAFVDCHGALLYWAIVAWDDHFGGAPIDFGAWPEQNRAYYTLSDARPSLADHYPGLAEEARLYAGLRDLTGQILGRKFLRHESGGEFLQVELCLVDSGWFTETVFRFIQQSGHGEKLQASKGYGTDRPSDKPMEEKERGEGERVGRGWRQEWTTLDSGVRGRRVLIDVDRWKTFVADRFLLAPGSNGCLMLPGKERGDLRLLADHLSAEYGEEKRYKGRVWHRWKTYPERPDNHLWDCCVGAAAAASVKGMEWTAPAAAAGKAEPPRKAAEPVDIEVMYARENGIS